MLTTSINKPVLLRFSHVKYRSHQMFLRINATWKVRVLDCDQIWLIRLYLWFSGDKQILSLNIDPHKIVESENSAGGGGEKYSSRQNAAEIAMAGSGLSQSDCRTPRLLLSVALLTRTRINGEVHVVV